jgi:hypothetical protein
VTFTEICSEDTDLVKIGQEYEVLSMFLAVG